MTAWDGKTIAPQDKRILELIHQGLSQTEIAADIGRTRGHVNNRVKIWIERGIVNARVVEQTLTDEGRKLLRKAGR